MIKEHHAVLHGLAIKKYADANAVAAVVQLPVEDVAETFEILKGRQLVYNNGDLYSLTPVGGVVLGTSYSRFYGDIRTNADMRKAYEAFEEVNTNLKALITDWQTIERGGVSVANDHSDTDYDNRIIDRLGKVHERIEVILARMTAHVPRLSIYRDKLLIALERAEDGDVQWVSEVRIESYHTVWFELHEDLLRILGETRGE